VKPELIKMNPRKISASLVLPVSTVMDLTQQPIRPALVVSTVCRVLNSLVNILASVELTVALSVYKLLPDVVCVTKDISANIKVPLSKLRRSWLATTLTR
jgi:hypothetical protein